MFTIRAGDGIPFPLKTGHAQSGGISSVLSVVNPDEEFSGGAMASWLMDAEDGVPPFQVLFAPLRLCARK